MSHSRNFVFSLIIGLILGIAVKKCLSRRTQISISQPYDLPPLCNLGEVYPNYVKPPHPNHEARELEAAISGGNDLDEITIVAILTELTHKDRLFFGRNIPFRRLGTNVTIERLWDEKIVLDNEIKRKFPGYFGSTLVAMISERTTYYANEIHNALSAVPVDSDTIVEILLSLGDNCVDTTADAFYKIYNNTLVDAISSYDNTYFGDFLRRLACGCIEKNQNDETAAQNDATSLYDVSYLDDPKSFRQRLIHILTTNGHDQLRKIFDHYEKLPGATAIEESIEKYFQGYERSAYIAVVRYARDKSLYYARKLYPALIGEIDTNTIIRIVVTRSDIDLHHIEDAYEWLYEGTLLRRIDEKIDPKNIYRFLLDDILETSVSSHY